MSFSARWGDDGQRNGWQVSAIMNCWWQHGEEKDRKEGRSSGRGSWGSMVPSMTEKRILIDQTQLEWINHGTALKQGNPPRRYYFVLLFHFISQYQTDCPEMAQWSVQQRTARVSCYLLVDPVQPTFGDPRRLILREHPKLSDHALLPSMYRQLCHFCLSLEFASIEVGNIVVQSRIFAL